MMQILEAYSGGDYRSLKCRESLMESTSQSTCIDVEVGHT